ncbi:MAG: hypothetical protein Q9187_004557 [Circinaria calcarea]
MKINPEARFSLDDVRRHPWFTRKNQYLGANGKLTNPIALATQMFENMKIDFTQDPMGSQRPQKSTDAMEVDKPDWDTKFASTQPETPISDIMFDWEKPPRYIAGGVSASQPTSDRPTGLYRNDSLEDRLAEEPSFSQFSATPSVPLSRTQFARQFRDILPSHSLTRFFSLWAFPALLPTISESLHRLGVPVPTLPPSALNGQDTTAWIKVKTMDARNCALSGDIVVERMECMDEGLVEVNFIKVKGDPVEWRRFFKKVVVLCKEAVYKPEE